MSLFKVSIAVACVSASILHVPWSVSLGYLVNGMLYASGWLNVFWYLIGAPNVVAVVAAGFYQMAQVGTAAWAAIMACSAVTGLTFVCACLNNSIRRLTHHVINALAVVPFFGAAVRHVVQRVNGLIYNIRRALGRMVAVLVGFLAAFLTCLFGCCVMFAAPALTVSTAIALVLSPVFAFSVISGPLYLVLWRFTAAQRKNYLRNCLLHFAGDAMYHSHYDDSGIREVLARRGIERPLLFDIFSKVFFRRDKDVLLASIIISRIPPFKTLPVKAIRRSLRLMEANVRPSYFVSVLSRVDVAPAVSSVDERAVLAMYFPPWLVDLLYNEVQLDAVTQDVITAVPLDAWEFLFNSCLLSGGELTDEGHENHVGALETSVGLGGERVVKRPKPPYPEYPEERTERLAEWTRSYHVDENGLLCDTALVDEARRDKHRMAREQQHKAAHSNSVYNTQLPGYRKTKTVAFVNASGGEHIGTKYAKHKQSNRGSKGENQTKNPSDNTDDYEREDREVNLYGANTDDLSHSQLNRMAADDDGGVSGCDDDDEDPWEHPGNKSKGGRKPALPCYAPPPPSSGVKSRSVMIGRNIVLEDDCLCDESATNMLYQKYHTTNKSQANATMLRAVRFDSGSDHKNATCFMTNDFHLIFPGDLFFRKGETYPRNLSEIPRVLQPAGTIYIGDWSTIIKVEDLEFMPALEVICGKLGFICRLNVANRSNCKLVKSMFAPVNLGTVSGNRVNGRHAKLDLSKQVFSHSIIASSEFHLQQYHSYIMADYSTQSGDCGSVLFSSPSTGSGVPLVYAVHLFGVAGRTINLALTFPKVMTYAWCSWFDLCLEGESLHRDNIKKSESVWRRYFIGGFFDTAAASVVAKYKSLVGALPSLTKTDCSKILAENVEHDEVYFEPSRDVVFSSALKNIVGKRPIPGFAPPMVSLPRLATGASFTLVSENRDAAIEFAMQKCMTDGACGSQDFFGIGYTKQMRKRDALKDPVIRAKVAKSARAVVDSIMDGKKFECPVNVYGKREWIKNSKLKKHVAEGFVSSRLICSLELPVHVAVVAIMMNDKGESLDDKLRRHHGFFDASNGRKPEGHFVIGQNLEDPKFREKLFQTFGGAAGGVEADISGWDLSITHYHISMLFKELTTLYSLSEHQGLALMHTMCGQNYVLNAKVIPVDGLWWPSGLPITLSGNGLMHAMILLGGGIKTFVVQGDDSLIRGDADSVNQLYKSHNLSCKLVESTIKGMTFVGIQFGPNGELIENTKVLARARSWGPQTLLYDFDEVVVDSHLTGDPPGVLPKK